MALLVGCSAAGSASGAPLPRWSAPRLVDHVAPFAYAWELDGLACPSASLCVGVGGDHIISSTDPAGGALWHSVRVDARHLRAISCPSASLCVVIDQSGDVLTSTEPTGSAVAWSISALTPGHELSDVACPSTRLCVAAGHPAGVLISTDPAGGPGTWSTPPIPGKRYSERVACPSTSMCIAFDEGSVSWLALDSNGHGEWKGTWSSSETSIVRSISCPSENLCVAVNDAGDALVSTTPTVARSAWSSTHIDSAGLQGVSCSSELLCVVVDGQGDLITSNNPAGGADAWSAPVNVDPNAGDALPGGGPLLALGIRNPTPAWRPQPQSVSCPTTALCVALDRYGHSITSTNPAAGASTWTLATAAEGADGFAAMSCPSPSLCAGIDNAGRVVSSTRPGSSRARWRVTTVPGLSDAYEWGIVCIRRPLCVAYDRSFTSIGHYQEQQMFASVHPNGGPRTWRAVKVPGYAVGSLPDSSTTSCPWRTICLTWRRRANVPTAIIVTKRKRHAHKRRRTYFPIYGDASCPSRHFCAWVGEAGLRNGELSYGSDPSGDLYTSAHPAASSKWRTTHIDAATLGGISCPTTKLCVAFDTAGNVLTSIDPTSAHAKWKTVHLTDSETLTELSCPSTHLCLGHNSQGDVVMTTAPTGDASSWTTQPLDPEGPITALACPSRRSCIAGDEAGNVLLGIIHGAGR